MDPPTTTFPCKLCNKVYSTQHSLTRHSHNHTGTHKHSCSICKVGFSRKDLLARHLKMIHSSDTSGGREGRRQRCHTACTNCRESRIKCDSKQPCASCIAFGKHCIYSARSARLSTRWQPDSMEVNEDAISPDLEHSQTAAEADDFESLQTDGLLESNNDLDLANGMMDTDQSHPQTCSIDTVGHNETSPGQMTAWPWLHEDLFLQQNSGWADFEPDLLDSLNFPAADMAASFSRMDCHIDDTVIAQIHPMIEPQLGTSLEPERHIPQTSVHLNDLPQTHKHARITGLQTGVVTELITYARKASFGAPLDVNHSTYWYSMSMRVREAFGDFSAEIPYTSTSHCLDLLIKLYWDNFWPLWPMIPAYYFDANTINPVLYLALSAIGAMYGGAEASHLGVMLHEALRGLLCEPMLDSDESEVHLLALAQARLLTQVTALYFGKQSRAFTFAQHLGSVLVAQTRRMDLYSPSRYRRELARIPTSTDAESQGNSRWLAHWLRAESRKRLAFGVLRVEVYTSVLLNARPMLCAEEIALELPCSNYLWLTEFSSDSQFIAAIRQDASSGTSKKLPFSDLIKITMDGDEAIIPLNNLDQEILIFGLQEHVWRLCHDPDTLFRLTGSQLECGKIYNGLDDSHSSKDQPHSHFNAKSSIGRFSGTVLNAQSLESRLNGHYRRMTGLRQDHQTTFAGLYKWRQSLSTWNENLSRNDRTSIISGLLLFHISFLRTFAPVEKLHHISYRIGSDSVPEAEIVRAVWTWSQTELSKIALQHACVIWSLLFQECSQPVATRALFNFLALLGLHHATVVIWCFAGTHPDGISDVETPGISLDISEDVRLPIVAGMSRELMTMVVKLYRYISPAWSVMSSFSAAAAKLANHLFPVQTD